MVSLLQASFRRPTFRDGRRVVGLVVLVGTPLISGRVKGGVIAPRDMNLGIWTRGARRHKFDTEGT